MATGAMCSKESGMARSRTFIRRYHTAGGRPHAPRLDGPPARCVNSAMRRILAVLLVAGLLVGLTAPAADARGGRGAGAAVVGLAAFALFAPLIIAGEVLAHTVPYRPVVVAPPPVYYA